MLRRRPQRQGHRFARAAGPVTTLSGRHRAPSAISLITRGRATAQPGPPGPVIFDAVIGILTPRAPPRVTGMAGAGRYRDSRRTVIRPAVGDDVQTCPAHVTPRAVVSCYHCLGPEQPSHPITTLARPFLNEQPGLGKDS